MAAASGEAGEPQEKGLHFGGRYAAGYSAGGGDQDERTFVVARRAAAVTAAHPATAVVATDPRAPTNQTPVRAVRPPPWDCDAFPVLFTGCLPAMSMFRWG
ncbi:hypothetical protein GCM10010094_49950 [Streptomyces flaveus]|uniref:Uncharacterized protein n=1 Tax=Streptomyces flaveus TaxID=66370 RepID=A0A917R0R5_9ACTN|nr:hypothetical protein GCM10010094_49950 [Streptomyces flaveus]